MILPEHGLTHISGVPVTLVFSTIKHDGWKYSSSPVAIPPLGPRRVDANVVIHDIELQMAASYDSGDWSSPTNTLVVLGPDWEMMAKTAKLLTDHCTWLTADQLNDFAYYGTFPEPVVTFLGMQQIVTEQTVTNPAAFLRDMTYFKLAA